MEFSAFDRRCCHQIMKIKEDEPDSNISEEEIDGKQRISSSVEIPTGMQTGILMTELLQIPNESAFLFPLRLIFLSAEGDVVKIARVIEGADSDMSVCQCFIAGGQDRCVHIVEEGFDFTGWGLIG